MAEALAGDLLADRRAEDAEVIARKVIRET